VSARLRFLVPVAIVALVAGCGETFISVSSDGRIEVFVSTTGTDPDGDGFSVIVDGGAARFVAPGGSVVLDHLSEGSHSVLLSGLSENCRVEGSNPRSVVVGPDGQADLSFDVRCGLRREA
jgi:streptogramin lyase